MLLLLVLLVRGFGGSTVGWKGRRSPRESGGDGQTEREAERVRRRRPHDQVTRVVRDRDRRREVVCARRRVGRLGR